MTMKWRSGRVAVFYLFLFALSIPWYFPDGSGDPLIAGFPLWCVVSLLSFVAAALLTVISIDDLWSEEEERSASPPRAR